MNKLVKILILEDKLTDVEFIQSELHKSELKFELKVIDNKLDYINAIATYNADVILANHVCQSFHSTTALELLKVKNLAIPFILVTDSVDETFAVRILKLGAADYILKSDLSRLPAAIKAALEESKQHLLYSEENYLRLEEVQEIAKIGFWSWIISTGEVEWSKEVYTIFGLDSSTFKPNITSILDLSPWPEDHARGQEIITKAIESKEVGSFEQRFLLPDKSTGYYYSSFRGNYSESGILESIIGTVIDITENKKKEEALQNSELLFRSLSSNAPVAIYQTDDEGKCNFVNDEWMNYSGMTFGEAMGFGWINALHPEDKERILEEWQTSLSTGAAFISEYRMQKSSGEIIWLSSKAVANINSEGKKTGYIGIATDISQRKEAEEKLLYSESLAKGIFNSNIIGFTYWDASGAIIDANDFFLETFGYSRQDVLDGNLRWDKMTPPEYAEIDQLALEQVAKTKVFAPYEKEYICKDGRRIPILIGAALIEKEVLTRGVAYVMDISERKKAEDQRYISEKRFRALVENSEGIITLLDANLNTIYRSKSNSKVTGWTFEESKKINTEEYIHPEDLERLKIVMIEALANPGKTIHSTARIKHKEGHYIWTEGTIKNMLHDPAIKGIITNMKDISERKNAEEKLKQSQNLTNAIFNSKVIGFFYFDANGEIIEANEFFLNTFGYTKQDLANGALNWDNMTPPEYAERDQLALKELAETGICLPYEKEFICKNGSKITILIGGGMFQEKETTKGYAYVLDVTERKKAEEALREQGQITKNIIENSNSIVYLFNTKGELLMSNKKFEDVTGLPTNLVIGKTRHDFLSKEVADRHRANDLEIIATKQSKIYEEENIEADRTHHYITAKFPLFSTDGKVYAVGGISTDVTVSKTAEEELQHTLHKLEEAQELSGLGHWEFDMKTYDRIWSKQVFKNYNFSVDSKLPKTEEILLHTHPDDRIYMNNAVEKAWKGLLTEPFIIRTNPEFGPVKYLLNIWQFAYNDTGELQKLLGTVQDVTNDKTVELKLIEQNEALKKANTELDRFVYSVSHDLRAPLKSMLGLTDLLQLELNSEDSDQSMLIDMIQKSVLKLDGFIEDILDYSRNGRVELNFEELNFEEIIEEIRGNHKFMDGAKDVVLNLDIQLGTPFVSDQGRVKIILNNLISNAVKYQNNKSEGSFVSIKIRSDQTKASIEVTDNGIGIAAGDHEKIFKMFHRASTLSTGSGLGLYIVNETIERLGGTIKLKSELEKGATFSLSIPNNI